MSKHTSIITMPLEDIMSERFGRYSKYVIQERALPDARDGLKPVQRRIIYSMAKEGNTFDKAYRKSAKTVGEVMGNYHPHGDSSIYDAMVRMAQNWKVSLPLIDMHGNIGSIDDLPAAAMRYTEARLSKLSGLLVEDINKDTINWTPTYDDSSFEPSVLPSYFPNLLVNGSMGIASGYATDIPPHNLGEIVDAVIKRIDYKNCRLETILEIVKGPDFPTGGIVMGKDGIKEAFETGKGKVIVRSKYELPVKKNSWKIKITEIPYGVVKSNLVREMDEIRVSGKISGIAEVRDESDRNGLTIAIDLKQDADPQLIVNYLLKNTQLQVSYNYNCVAIVDKRPMQLGLLELLDAYIEHQKDVVIRKSKFTLQKAKDRMHIVEGMVIAISDIDGLIETIKKSQDKKSATENVASKYGLTLVQAEAIVTLQLYRLTSTDINALKQEKAELETLIDQLNTLIGSESLVEGEIKKKLRQIRNDFAIERKSEIVEEVEEIKIEKEALIQSEDVYISISKDGYIKRSSNRSYQSSEGALPDVKDGDWLIYSGQANTLDKVIAITEIGNYLYIPVYELQEKPWKHVGEHISANVKISGQDKIVFATVVKSFETSKFIVMATETGLIKKSAVYDFEVTRYSKPITCMKLREDDRIISCAISDGNSDIMMISKQGYINRYNESEVAQTGIKSAGIKGITLRDDVAVSMLVVKAGETFLFTTDKACSKRLRVDIIPMLGRTTKGTKINKDIKTNPQLVVKAHVVDVNDQINCLTNNGQKSFIAKEIPLADVDTGNSQAIDKGGIILTSSKILSDVIVAQEGFVRVKNDSNENKQEAVDNSQMQLSIDDFEI